MARAPTTASAASTQKSIASIHSPLSLAVGYNRIVTHGRRPCNSVVAILAKDKTLAAAQLGVGPQPLYAPGRAAFLSLLRRSLCFAPSKRCAGPRVVRP